MLIKRGFLHDDDGNQVSFKRSPNQSGALKPRYIIMHYTAGSSAESSIRHLTKPGAGASAHIVIGQDGAVTQLVAFNRVAWHAGKSSWQGIKGLNRHSIGIELDNAGPLRGGPGNWRSWFKRLYPDEDVMVAAHKNEAVERGWHEYSEIQIEAALAVSEALFSHYRLIDVLGHDDIAPNRKQDPGPAFPMDNFRSKLVGRASDDVDRFVTTAAVNIRKGPGTQHAKLDGSPLAKGTALELQSHEGSWCHVDVMGDNGDPIQSGWLHGNYIAPVAGVGD